MIYRRIKASFTYAKDKLWRSLYVREDITLEELGCVLCVSLRSALEYSFLFLTEERRYVPESFGELSKTRLPMRDHTLADLGEEFEFEYDTGDGWNFFCKVYKRTKEIDSGKLAFFDGGEGLGIWEDGISSFSMLVSGQVSPDRTADDESIGFYMPWNLTLK